MTRGRAHALVGTVAATMLVSAFVFPAAGGASPASGPGSGPAPTPAPTGPVDEVGDPGPVERPWSKVRLRRLPGGTHVVKGTREVVGTRGRIVRYTIEVQSSIAQRKRRAVQLEAVTRWALGDEERGWTARGERRMQRVGKVSQARLRIVLATPTRVDRICRRGGTYTVGQWSCYNSHGVVALNKMRWRTGARGAGFDSLDAYRLYLVNHEVGHALGYGHRKCSRRGALASVMLQQSRTTYGCRSNGWPYPAAT